MCKSISTKEQRKVEVYRIHIATEMDFNRRDYEEDGGGVHVGGELQLFLIRNEKPRIFKKRKK